MKWSLSEGGADMAAMRREMEELRQGRLLDSVRIRTLENENAELWQVVAFLWTIQEEPQPHPFKRLRFKLSPLGGKLKAIHEKQKEGRK
jgi:hypothetical protein